MEVFGNEVLESKLKLKSLRLHVSSSVRSFVVHNFVHNNRSMVKPNVCKTVPLKHPRDISACLNSQLL